MRPLSLEDLFVRYRRDGDPQALAELFDRSAPEVYRVARYLSGNQVDAEDLVQSTYLIAIERADSFRVGARVVPWLLGILANKARELTKEARRHRARSAGTSVPTVDPTTAAEGHELRQHLEEQLEGLSPALRPVLALHLLHGLSAAEIAKVLDRPAGTVRSQVCRGMERLREALPPGLLGVVAVVATPHAAMAQLRSVVLSRAKELAVSAIGGVTLTTTLALIMNKLLLASLGVLLAVTLALTLPWGTWLEGTSQSPPSDTAPAFAVASGSDSRTRNLDRAPLARDATELAAPGQDVLQVQVVFADSGEPAPGAAVRFQKTTQWLENAGKLILEARDDVYDEQLRRGGFTVFTDIRGRARVPGDGLYTDSLVCGVLPGYYAEVGGLDDWQLTGETLVIPLEPDREMAVQVVGPDGAPMPGAPVGLRVRSSSGVFASQTTYLGVAKEPDGILRIPHAQCLSRQVESDGRHRFELVPFVVGEIPAGVWVDAGQLPDEPVQLPFPPTGSLQVVIEDAYGKPWRPGMSTTGHPRTLNQNVPGSLAELFVRRKSEYPIDDPFVSFPPDAEGVYDAPFIALGHELELAHGGGGGAEIRQNVTGPKIEGERVEVTLRYEPSAFVRGRLRLPDGEPAVDRAFRLLLAGFRTGPFRTDADGGFVVGADRWEYGNLQVGEQLPFFIVEDLPGTQRGAARSLGPPLQVVGRIGLPREGETVDLNERQLASMPLLAAGEVLSELPLREVRLHMRSPARWDGEPMLQSPVPFARWTTERDFELYGWTERPEPSFRVYAHWHTTVEVPFEPGSRGLTVPLGMARQITASVLYAADRQPSLLRARMVPETEAAEPPRFILLTNMSVGGQGTGSWTFKDLAPGTYRFEVFGNASPGEPVYALSSVRVGDERISHDPRLEAIDLRDLVRYVDLRVLSPEGEVLKDATIHLGLDVPGAYSVRYQSFGGPTLSTSLSAPDLLVSAPGYQLEPVLNLREDRDVRMRPAIEVRARPVLEVSGDLPAQRQIDVVWQLDPASMPVAEQERQWVDSWGTDIPVFRGRAELESTATVLQLPSPGTYRVTLELRAKRSAAEGVLTEKPLVFTVRDVPGQEWTLPISPARLREALRER